MTLAPVIIPPRGTFGRWSGGGSSTGSRRSSSSCSGSSSGKASSAALDVERFLLPAPSAILSTLRDERELLWNAGLYTFSEALGGFVIGSAFAIVFAVVLARFRGLGRSLMPFAIAANAIPIIAFAPITNPVVRPAEQELEDGDRRHSRLLSGAGRDAPRADLRQGPRRSS